MRMQFYGKSSPNLVAGVLLIFSLIVLYNYWNVSTYNKDLAVKLHTLEQQSISISRANIAIQSNLEQAHEENRNLQLGLKKEEVQEKDIRAQLLEKERQLKKLQNELQQSKQESEILREEKETSESKISSKDEEIKTLKEKVVNLEAQIEEKNSANEELTKDLSNSKKEVERAEKLIDKLKSSNTASSSSTTTVAKAKVDDLEPVLMNDPAVPYPDGWMGPYRKRIPVVSVKHVDLEGVVGHHSPVIIFDPPNSRPVKARFSVLDPPKPGSSFYRPVRKLRLHLAGRLILPVDGAENIIYENEHEPEQQMGPDPVPLKTPDKAQSDNNGMGVGPAPLGGEEDIGADNAGVLALPGVGGGNLDAQEDDGDHPLKELQDDQSPDGVLTAKELVGVGPAPPKRDSKNDIDQADILPAHHSGQDIREAAHLGENINHNTL